VTVERARERAKQKTRRERAASVAASSPTTQWPIRSALRPTACTWVHRRGSASASSRPANSFALSTPVTSEPRGSARCQRRSRGRVPPRICSRDTEAGSKATPLDC
jgi:hypothetical protein